MRRGEGIRGAKVDHRQLLFDCQVAIRAISDDTKGPGWTLMRLALALGLTAVLSLSLATSVSAATVHLFKETFGSASVPNITNPQGLAIDSSGNIIVIQAGTNEKQVVTLTGATSGTFKLNVPTAKGIGQTISGSSEVTGVKASLGSFRSRDAITGSGVPAGTVITAVGAGTLTLSNPATATGSAPDLVATETTAAIGTGNTTASNKFVKNVTTIAGNFTPGQRIESAGFITSGSTTIAKVINSTELELSANATSTGNGIALNAPGLPFNVSTANLRIALEGLPGIGVGNVAVTGTPGSSYTVEFKGSLAGTDIDEASCDGSALTGSSPTCTISTLVPGVVSALKRFASNGNPANFAALGTNVIDARRGSGGKTLAECGTEAASCDETPQGNFIFGAAKESQITIDNSGGVTNGNIYVTETSRKLVDIFAADGRYLGQLTQYRGNEEQKLEFTGFSAGPGNEFILGNLPPACTASATSPISYLNTGTGKESIVAALEAKCGSSGFSNFGAVGNPPNTTISFQGQFASQDLGQLTCTKVAGPPGSCVVATTSNGLATTAFGEICGVAVDSSGRVYAGEPSKALVHKFAPSASLPTTSDSVLNINGGNSGICSVTAGTAASNGFIFAGKENGPISKIDAATGQLKYVVSSGNNTTQAVNPLNGRLLTASGSIATEYDASGLAISSPLSTLTAASTIQGVAVNGATGSVYISRLGSGNLEVFGPPVSTPTPGIFAATEITVTNATLNGSVNAEGDAISSCRFEYLTQSAYAANGNSYSGPNAPLTKQCDGAIPIDTSSHPVTGAIGGLAPNTTYHFRLFAENGAGGATSSDKLLVTASSVFTGGASSVADSTATLNGTVNPVGSSLTGCKFEILSDADYLANGVSYSGAKLPITQACIPAAASIDADFQPHAVSAAISGLAKNTLYHFRLVANNASGAMIGSDQTFTTLGTPQVVEQYADPVGKDSATLIAKVNPSGFATNYHFEWGTDSSYGTRIPADFDLFVGSGSSPIKVVANLTGLRENSTYHFRLTATNSSGSTQGSDQEFTTLDSANLPNNRGIELVSPADKRPVGSVYKFGLNQLYFEAAEDGQSVSYPIFNALAGSPAGGEAIFASTRGENQWNTTELTPPSLIATPHQGSLQSVPGFIRYIDHRDFKCAIVETYNPLTTDTPAVDGEDGVTNLYRWNRIENTYTLITNRVPTNPTATVAGSRYYGVAGASADCSRVFFRPTIYSFIPGASGLYEWDNGVLRDAGRLPDHSVPSGNVGADVAATENTVSPDGKLFFVATSNEGKDATKPAVFVRKSTGETVDASQSKTAVSSQGARYETASPDGSNVFFLANYGLAATSSGGAEVGSGENCSAVTDLHNTACDLYDFNVSTGQLTDISADINAADTKGAVVQGVMDVSENGSTVYFAARGQLVPGRGRTYLQNKEGEGFASVYRWTEGHVTYIGSVGSRNLNHNENANRQGALIHSPVNWVSQTNKSGNYFLFVSRVDLTGANPNGALEAYLFSGETEALSCVSCPRDGSPPLPEGKESLFLGSYGSEVIVRPQPGSAYAPSSLSENGRVIFTVEDALTPDAKAGKGTTLQEENNIYEWYKGQRFLLTSGNAKFVDMGGPDGRDIFVNTYRSLLPQDFDFAGDLYDFRAGGGFPVPANPPTPCAPAEDQCQGSAASAPVISIPQTSHFSGPSNPAIAPRHKPRRTKHQRKRHHGKHKKGRAANTKFGGVK